MNKPTLTPHREPSTAALVRLFRVTDATVRGENRRAQRQIMLAEWAHWRHWLTPAQLEIVTEARRLGLNPDCPGFRWLR
jgi:hypothetical protein